MTITAAIVYGFVCFGGATPGYIKAYDGQDVIYAMAVPAGLETRFVSNAPVFNGYKFKGDFKVEATNTVCFVTYPVPNVPPPAQPVGK